MAGLKKNKRTKDSSSPNLVLVLFLIVFILSNIILGLWVYFNYETVNKALTDKTKADKDAATARTAVTLYQTAADDFRLALGQKPNADDMAVLSVKRGELLADNSPFTKLGEKNTDAYKKLIATLRNDLGWDEGSGTYSKTYQEEIAKAQRERDDAVATLGKIQKQLKDAQEQFNTLAEKQNAYQESATARFDKDRKDLNKVANTQSEEMKRQIQKNDELREAIAAADAKRADLEKKYKKQLAELEETIKDKDKGSDAAVLARDGREPHALLLDISTGKPLWDDPVGMITRVDYKTKEVTINLGSAKGVRPDLTFNVFAPSKTVSSRPEKKLKGTVEVIRVLGPYTSVARITATFDPEFPLQDGDLLFNLFWGTRVAIAGYVDVTGAPTESPSEQMRQLNDFMYLLSRQGIIIDAYLDLTDGQVKGALTPNTRYLIRGDDLSLPVVDKKKGEEPRADPRADRAIAVNNGILAMRKDAIDKGIFVISSRNFATVIGYQRAGREQTAFQPSLPSAGPIQFGLSAGVGAIGARPEPAPAPMPMPMPPEKKKDDN